MTTRNLKQLYASEITFVLQRKRTFQYDAFEQIPVGSNASVVIVEQVVTTKWFDAIEKVCLQNSKIASKTRLKL